MRQEKSESFQRLRKIRIPEKHKKYGQRKNMQKNLHEAFLRTIALANRSFMQFYIPPPKLNYRSFCEMGIAFNLRLYSNLKAEYLILF
jgi:hypothetical protein